MTAHAIGSDGKLSAKLNVDAGPTWDVKRRLIELTVEFGREYFIVYDD